MKYKFWIIYLFFTPIILSCKTSRNQSMIVLQSNVPVNIQVEENICSVEDVKLVNLGREYIYFDRDSLFLKLTKAEALEREISLSEYENLCKKIKEMNIFLQETIRELPEGKKVNFPVPINRIIDALNISEKINIQLTNKIE